MTEKIKCVGCDALKDRTEFEKIARQGVVLRKKCARCRQSDRKRYIANREQWIAESGRNQKKNAAHRRVYLREYMRLVRAEIVAKLGGKCKRCGFDDPRALQIDHVNGDGWTELKGQIGKYAYLKKVLADMADRYQLLCANCNWIKRAEEDERPFIGKAAKARAAME